MITLDLLFVNPEGVTLGNWAHTLVQNFMDKGSLLHSWGDGRTLGRGEKKEEKFVVKPECKLGGSSHRPPVFQLHPRGYFKVQNSSTATLDGVC